ncbi:hypothetical protein KAV67_01950 [Candidatus Bipolaricaulota bacterium]|nr:hypothetical protein [Candidatus Bipolaricaulota bacterium]
MLEASLIEPLGVEKYGGGYVKFQLVLIFIPIALFVSLSGYSAVDFSEADFRLNATLLSDNSWDYAIKRLTDNSYQDSAPQIAMDNSGTVAVLWLSLEMRTPVIKGRFLSTDGWSEEQELGACVGHWDITLGPRGGFLLVRSHWGNLYARELMLGGKEKQISSGMISSPSILVTNSRACIIWQRKISERVNAIEGAIYRDSDWSDPIQILTTEQRIVRSLMLSAGDELLLVVVLGRDGGSSICLARLSQGLHLVIPLTKLRDLSTQDYPNAEGAITADGSPWLAWEEGAKGEEQIYVSSCSDGKVWSEPERISIIGERNLDPAIAVDEDVIYVIWTSFDQKGGEGKQYGRIRGRWHELGAEGWQEIEGLYQEGVPILGRDAAIAAGGDRVWLAWECEEEIYMLQLQFTGCQSTRGTRDKRSNKGA